MRVRMRSAVLKLMKCMEGKLGRRGSAMAEQVSRLCSKRAYRQTITVHAVVAVEAANLVITSDTLECRNMWRKLS